MLFLIVIFALIGLAFGGPVGLLVGGGLGWWLGRRIKRRLNEARMRIQEGFLDSIFSVMGCLCQADGKVTDGELDVAEKLFDQMRLQGEQRTRARAAFERGRSDDFDLDAELASVNRLTRHQPVMRQVFLQVQLSAIAADGVLHDAEHEMILRVARGVGCSETEVQQIEAMLHGAAANSQGASEEALKDAYRVLGVSEDASDAEVKKAYRRLMSQNHPDKLAGKGLPESMRDVAQARTSEISNAYERIREARDQ
ncbi:co-chaperone DjlA [Halomonas janggokensis]|jgi:DnaJ like chaperone protein|uniref:Co-chaperone DjlA n=1 Tax=Vreelandella janggokensis TaxID=370767 RepID=A0ABT4IWN7_9GAMM|nr:MULTISPECIES: co-chaperone DjlA [Halomonas]MCW4150705.1 co-chaperone DjlA [Halomonas sp. 18H]MCZ0927394.1 co-chaperone DjlA [Halomonas janggokensis]MCZ0929902.1 co-chaperone DjlA [Halomonas janggokensis]QPL45976.1 co-chaperone DjlA [Halomonas sp. A40-4]